MHMESNVGNVQEKRVRSRAATRVNVAQCRARENRGENIDENSVTRGERRGAAALLCVVFVPRARVCGMHVCTRVLLDTIRIPTYTCRQVYVLRGRGCRQRAKFVSGAEIPRSVCFSLQRQRCHLLVIPTFRFACMGRVASMCVTL